jgi:hypothetical protein
MRNRREFSLLICAIGLVTFIPKYVAGELDAICFAGAIVAVIGLVLWLTAMWQQRPG